MFHMYWLERIVQVLTQKQLERTLTVLRFLAGFRRWRMKKSAADSNGLDGVVSSKLFVVKNETVPRSHAKRHKVTNGICNRLELVRWRLREFRKRFL